MKAAVSLRDIARRARVSHVTVSNVLNRAGREKEVSSRTALLIRRLAREMNYVPNQAARTLKLGKTQTIALASRNSLRYAYSHELVEGLQAQLSTCGYHLNLELLHRAPDEAAVYRTFVPGRYDGVIQHGLAPEQRPWVAAMRRSGMPVVVIDVTTVPGVDQVTYDHVEAIRLGISHLIAQDHARVALVLNRQPGAWRTQCEEGYRLAYAQNALPCYESLIVPWTVGSNPDGLWPQIAAIVPRPTAVCCYNAELAAALLRSVRKHGLKVPHDVALATVGEVGLNTLLEVPMTTVDTHYEEVARIVAERLLAQIQDPTIVPQKILIKPSLIVRESSVGSLGNQSNS